MAFHMIVAALVTATETAQAGILTILSADRQTPLGNLGTCLRCQETTDGTHVTRTNISELPHTPI